MAERFYCPDAALAADGRHTLELVDDEARHLSRVRRVGVGEFVEVFDGLGYATCAEVLELRKDRVTLRATGTLLADRQPAVRLTLATAVPKGERFDWLIEKATELGVERVVPLITERSVVDPRGAKLDRLRRSVIEAAKQCGRNTLMDLREPTPLNRFLAEADCDPVRLFAHPGGVTFPGWPASVRDAPVVVAIGPEGGFTEGEADAARQSGWLVVGLGATLLRVETAAITACVRLLALGESLTEQEG